MSSISELFFGKPWAVEESLLEPMTDIVYRHLDGKKLSDEDIQAITRFQPTRRTRPEDRRYEVVGGAAIIPIYGVISKRANLVERISQGVGTSTLVLAEDIRAALNDDEVKEIILDIDSPGGSVGGVSEVADLIYNSRGKKPINAYANGLMASAAYWIGSAADNIYATKTTQVGSIGVYSVVYDATVMQHNRGIKTHVIRAGKYKAAGNPEKAFTEEDHKVIQTQIMKFFDLFAGDVKKFRGFSDEQISAVANGLTFLGNEALELGLIDEIKELVLTELETNSVGNTGSEKFKSTASGQDITKKSVQTTTEDNNMELSDLTIEKLSESCPDLVAQMKEEHRAEFKENQDALIADAKKTASDEATQAATQAERNRCAALHAKGMLPEYASCAGIVQNAIISGETVEATEGKMKDQRMRDLENGGSRAVTHSEGNDDKEPATKEMTPEERVEKAKEYKKEHSCSMQEALSAVSQ